MHLLVTNKKLIFLSRDHAGIKPLYYSIINGTLVFGSKLRNIDIVQLLNRQAAYHVEYLWIKCNK